MRFWITLSPFLFASCADLLDNGKPRLTDKIVYPGAMSGSLVEGRRTFVGHVTIKPGVEDSVECKVTTVDGETIHVEWPSWAEEREKIDANAIHQVDILTRIYKDPDYVFNNLLRIRHDGKVFLDASVCHIHGKVMERKLENGVSAEGYADSFFKMRQKKFPNDGNVYMFCGSGIRHPMWKCGECHETYLAWCKRNGVDPTW